EQVNGPEQRDDPQVPALQQPEPRQAVQPGHPGPRPRQSRDGRGKRLEQQQDRHDDRENEHAVSRAIARMGGPPYDDRARFRRRLIQPEPPAARLTVTLRAPRTARAGGYRTCLRRGWSAWGLTSAAPTETAAR